MIQQNSLTPSASMCSRPDPNLPGITLIELNPKAPLKAMNRVVRRTELIWISKRA